MTPLLRLLLALPLAAGMSGCGIFWDQDGGNISVLVENRTDATIAVYYDTVESDGATDGEHELIRPGRSAWVDVEDEGWDGEVTVEYLGRFHTYDIDPDFWATDEIVVRTSHFPPPASAAAAIPAGRG
ncbi:MAG: hypothetical protein RLZZ127_1959 [Planctomycetota bacterium]|jgi:hypothetical protein